MATGGEGAWVEIFGYTVDLMDELGRGGFGTVYKGFNRESAETVAMKKVSKMEKRKAITEAVRCYYLKRRIVHRNIVKVFDVKSWKEAMWITMEYCNQGDLNDYFKNNNTLKKDIEIKAKIMKQIADGIAFLHDEDIVHRDIKPGNVLVTTNDLEVIIKLSDFGLSKILDPDDLTSAMSSDVGTMMFKAPEFWDKNPPDESVRYHRNIDVYSAGLTFTAMLQARPGQHLVPKAECYLQSSDTNMAIGFAAFTRKGKSSAIIVVEDEPTDDDTTRQIKELIHAMTQMVPEERFAARDVVETFNVLLEVGVILCFFLKYTLEVCLEGIKNN